MPKNIKEMKRNVQTLLEETGNKIEDI